MIDEYLQQIYDVFRNVTLNTLGIKRNLYDLLQSNDVSKAIELFADHDTEIEKAIEEYNPQTHQVMKRRNKFRKGDDPYITEKLPRTWQRYINEIELFFLLGNPIKWKKTNGDDEAFGDFMRLLKDTRFDSKMRQLKRLAGCETEAALSFHIYNDNGAVKYDNFIVARSKGYRTRTLFDQYGNLQALAYGYTLKEGTRNFVHWDIQTAEWLFYCTKESIGWNVEIHPNPTNKINAIVARQNKAWDGVVPRIERDEMLDSKLADTNNYFSDPIAAATADVIENLKSSEKIARMMQLTNSNSKFEYVNPPQSSDTRNAEKAALKESILYDTFTPDFSYDALKGFGSLSGAALKNAMVLGYIKRARNLEVYDELVDRYKNVCMAVLKLLNPTKASEYDVLQIEHEFADPFAQDERMERNSVAEMFKSGLLSRESAVALLSMVDKPNEEVERIKAEAEEQAKKQQEEQKK